jgi:adenosyl cobinamide kinase/adenosyl cobinamide phosphate guanylyltransferase
VTYVATATAAGADTDGEDGGPAAAPDEDFAVRIARHRARRPASWSTVEVGGELAAILRTTRGSVLVDALGTWLARHERFDADVVAVCRALGARDGDTVVVSDEVGLGVHPSTEAGRHFRDALGTVNRAVADVADRVLLVVAGRVLDLPRAADVLGW